MDGYHEPWDALPAEARDFHRALSSLREEIEAVDWYHQRAVVAADDELRRVIEHNRDEEIEHACMVLEWLRRRMPGWDDQLRKYLFSDLPITEKEEQDSQGGAPDGPTPRGLGVGSLKSK